MIWMKWLGALALAVAVSLDSLVAGAGLGAGGVRVPFRSALAAGATGGAAVAAALFAGGRLSPFLPAAVAGYAGGAVLLAVGTYKFFESTIRMLLTAAGGGRQFGFSLGGLRILLEVYLAPDRADTDHSSLLSVREALVLGIVLALDGAVAGLGAGLSRGPALLVPVACTLLGAVGLWGGAAAGRRLSWRGAGPAGGAILMLLGLARIFH